MRRYYSLISPLDAITIAYMLLTAIYLGFGAVSFSWLLPHLTARGGMLLVFVTLVVLKSRFPESKTVNFVKSLYPLLFLGFFYTETSAMRNIIFANDLDAYLVNAEQRLFHCQPSLEFSKCMSANWFNELMNLCYFSYYILIGTVCITLYFKQPLQSVKNIFVVAGSFYLYYVVFALFPTVGPQYFLHDQSASPEPIYLFSRIMHHLVTHYEQPTGAFPSSHVGIATVLSIITFKYHKPLFYVVLPFTIGICFATVYLKEHYLLDVIAGILSAPLFIRISSKAYSFLSELMGIASEEENLVTDNSL